jgi:ubiquinone/menaquinone biosynthesis C-methylase UbiE
LIDGIIAATAIEQTPDPYRALREVFRVLKPGGRFRVSFETYGTTDRGFAERIFTTETDDSYGYHYSIMHHRPPWERSYLLKFAKNDATKEAFAALAAQIERLGQNPAVNTEIGLGFVEKLQEHVAGSSWYGLEHFTSGTMKETLEDVGFVNVRCTWSAATLARRFWPRIADAGMPDPQAQAVCQGLADMALVLDAPLDSGEPVVATKPS